jgi:PAS domain S-box-containing protein
MTRHELPDDTGDMEADGDRRMQKVGFAVTMVLLILAGLVGNYFTLPLFFGADFLFGSITVLLVLCFYGLGWGMVAAILVHSYTYFLWGHPYGWINFVSEALFVGLFLKRGYRNVLGLDGLFWLIVGMPMAWVYHGVFMQMGGTTASFIMLKQAINGIFNALIASLLICYLPLERLTLRAEGPRRTSLRESLFNLLVVMVLFPALLFTRLEIKREKERLEAGVMAELQSMSANAELHLRSWFQLHLRGVKELALQAGRTPMTPSPQLQHIAEVLNHSFPDFRTMHVENSEGRAIVFHPLLNEKGEPTLGLDFSKRPWFQEIKAKQQPLVSEVFVGYMAVFSPIVNLSEPVFKDNRWAGCATATLDLKRIQETLRPYRSDRVASLTLTDRLDRVIASTDQERSPLQLWNRKKTGATQPIRGLMYLWHPEDKKLPSMSRWKQSYFVQEILLDPDLPWKLTAEAPVAPLQAVLYALYVKNLAIMACLTGLALLLAQMFSGSLTRPLARLAIVTANLPEKLLGAQNIDWPASSTQEVDGLIRNFRSTAKALEANFHQLRVQSDELRKANQELGQEVRERRQAEDAVRESGERLKKILDSLDVGVMIVDARSHRILSINPKALSLFGTSEGQAVGRVCHHYICPAEQGRCPISDLGQTVNASERTLLTAQGNRIPIIKSVVRTNITGQDCLVESFIDITESKRVEKALQESETNLKGILESTADGILAVDSRGKLITSNARFAHLWRIPQDILERSDDGDLLSYVLGQLADPEAFLAKVRALYDSDQEDRDILLFKDSRVFERYSRPLTLKGSIVGRVWSFRDITDRKRAEEALQSSEERYRSLVNHATDMIFIAQDGILKFPNPAATTLSGYSEQELVTLPFVEIIHPEDREVVVEKHRQRLRGEEVPNTYSFRILNKAGDTLWVQLNAVLITWEGRPGVLCSLRDITPQKRLEAQYLHAQKMEAIGTLAGGVAHDFNNLLQAVLGYAQVLLIERKEEDPAYELLFAIQQAAQRGAELTRQLLTFSRKVQSKQRILDLNQEVVQVEKLLQRTIPKMIQVELRLAGELWSVSADSVQIGQLMMNLAVNARDAMPEGGRLEIGTRNVVLDGDFCRKHMGSRPGRHVALSVSDTGHGMGKEVLDHLFEPFFTTKGVGRGTGLGLAMVYGIVKGHNGYIECESEPDKGTRFRIYFPAAEQAAEPERAEKKEEPQGGKETILLVDDEAPLRDLARKVLSRFGYTVLTAPDGEGALEIYRAQRESIHLVILDLIMPGLGGAKCLEELLLINPDVKALIATGYSPEDSGFDKLEDRARGFIRKPYNIDELLNGVRKALGCSPVREGRNPQTQPDFS